MSKPKAKAYERFIKHIQEGIDKEPIYNAQVIDAAVAMLKGALTQEAHEGGPENAWDVAHIILEHVAEEIQKTLEGQGISPKVTHQEEGRVN